MRRSLWIATLALGVACRSRDAEPPPKVERETASDEIARVAHVWRSHLNEKGFRSAPSAISMFDTLITSTVKLAPDARTATETITLEEALETRDGRRFRCKSEGSRSIGMRYGRRHGAAAVEMVRLPLVLKRRCQPLDFPFPEHELPASASRFKLRGDQLVPFAPPTERRVYLPLE